MASDQSQSEGALDTLYNYTEYWPEPPTIPVIEAPTVYHATLVQISNEFKLRLK